MFESTCGVSVINRGSTVDDIGEWVLFGEVVLVVLGQVGVVFRRFDARTVICAADNQTETPQQTCQGWSLCIWLKGAGGF